MTVINYCDTWSAIRFTKHTVEKITRSVKRPQLLGKNLQLIKRILGCRLFRQHEVSG